MNNPRYNYHREQTGGYVALMATIIIGAMLLVATVDVGMLGAAARFSILGTESKAQAHAMVRGCVDYAAAQLLSDTTYRGGATTTLPFGTCFVFPFAVDVPSTGLVTFKVQANVNQAVTNLIAVIKYQQVVLSPLPSPVPSASPQPARVQIISLQEVPTLP